MWLWIFLGAVLLMVFLTLITAFISFRMAFYVTEKQKKESESRDIPNGEIYEPYRELMVNWRNEAKSLVKEEVTITSFDGLTLHGKYYEFSKGAPIELMFHGYRGSAQRDLCGGVQRCFKLGRNALIVDQRTSGESEGNVITFGVNESRDCLSWIDFMLDHFGSDIKIILTGISMGASTVMMAAGMELPKNVIYVLADCGYTSQKEIIKKVIRQMKLPAGILYPFVKLGARLFGHFDLEERTALEAMKKTKIPVIFIHGDTDDFVPCSMSEENFNACIAPKKLLIVKGAGHGLGYLVDNEGYFKALVEFSNEIGLPTKLTAEKL